MKKKLLLTLSALVCAAVCAFGLAACTFGGTTTGSDNAGTGGNPEPDEAPVIVTLDKTELTLEIGETATLMADASPNPSLIKSAKWSVSPEGIVTVQDGEVTAVAAGNAVVTVTAEGKSATCAVTVKGPSYIDVAGKTFIFDDVFYEDEEYTKDWTDGMFEQVKKASSGTVFIFAEDNKFTNTKGAFTQTGTYVQEGDAVTVTVTSAVMGSTVMDIGDGFDVQLIVDCDKLLSPVINGANGKTVGYQIYVVKTEE